MVKTVEFPANRNRKRRSGTSLHRNDLLLIDW